MLETEEKECEAMVAYGAHFSARGIEASMAAVNAKVAQVFLGSPKSWRSPATKTEKERAFWSAFEYPVFVHSSYLINPASDTIEVRSNSLRSLNSQFEAAQAIQASGVVIHAGQAPKSDLKTAALRWREALKEVDTRGVPLLIENTAGGNVALGRSLDGLKLLWDAIGEFNPQVCFDTCHAWTGNMLSSSLPPLDAFVEVVDNLTAMGASIALTHLNGSRDPRNSGRDHHSNLTNSLYSLEDARTLAEYIGAPVILETPGPTEKLKQELAMLRRANAD